MRTDPTEISIVDEIEEAKAPAVAPTDVNEADDEKILPKGADLNADGSVTLTLLHPKAISIRSAQGVVREENYDRITFHRLTGADLNAIRATAPEHQQLVLFTRSARMRSAIMQALFARLDAADVTRAGRVLDTFF